jgi:hypothetical protein
VAMGHALPGGPGAVLVGYPRRTQGPGRSTGAGRPASVRPARRAGRPQGALRSQRRGGNHTTPRGPGAVFARVPSPHPGPWARSGRGRAGLCAVRTVGPLPAMHPLPRALGLRAAPPAASTSCTERRRARGAAPHLLPVLSACAHAAASTSS